MRDYDFHEAPLRLPDFDERQKDGFCNTTLRINEPAMFPPDFICDICGCAFNSYITSGYVRDPGDTVGKWFIGRCCLDERKKEWRKTRLPIVTAAFRNLRPRELDHEQD